MTRKNATWRNWVDMGDQIRDAHFDEIVRPEIEIEQRAADGIDVGKQNPPRTYRM